jgi:hypothetical protein
MEQCLCDVDPNQDDCYHGSSNVNHDYATLPFSPTASYNYMGSRYTERVRQYFNGIDQGDECYDIEEDGPTSTDVTIRIYHKLGYDNGEITCNSNAT